MERDPGTQYYRDIFSQGRNLPRWPLPTLWSYITVLPFTVRISTLLRIQSLYLLPHGKLFKSKDLFNVSLPLTTPICTDYTLSPDDHTPPNVH